MTAKELREIGKRVQFANNIVDHERLRLAEADRARLYAALEGLIIEDDDGKPFFAIRVPKRLIHRTKDAAIDALLQGGGE